MELLWRCHAGAMNVHGVAMETPRKFHEGAMKTPWRRHEDVMEVAW